MARAPKKLKIKRDRDGTKDRLLKAALDVFSKSGYDAATTRAIARKARVNESLIHRYFKSKLGLFIALKQEFRENLITQFLVYDESENLQDELLKFMNFRLQYTRKGKKFFKLALSRAILDPKAREDLQSYAKLKPVALVERFERFRDRGQIRKNIDLEQAIGVIHILAFAFSILMDAIECLGAEDTKGLVEVAAEMLAAGLAPKTN
jgi:AcrR family transcriptional regulator